MFLLHSSFHTKFESRFLQIDHQIKLSCRSNGFTVGITLPTPKCRSCRSEGHLSLQTSSFILPIGGSLKNALFQRIKNVETLLGSTWIICPRHEESLNQFFSCKKRKSLEFFTWDYKNSLHFVLFELKKKFFFWATKNFVCLPKYPIVSRPVRR